MSRAITAGQHARIVVASHLANNTPGLKEWATFAKPGESQADAIKRLMRKLRAEKRAAPSRTFPKSAEALANTKAYVEAYYRMNFTTEMQGYTGGASAFVRDLFGELSTAPATWPETDEVEVEVLEN